MKSHFDTNLHIHRPAILQGGLEAPLLDGFNRLCIQSEAQAADHAYVARVPGFIDNQPQNTCALSLCQSRLFGIFRVGRGNRLRG